jgi:hypothetical protein
MYRNSWSTELAVAVDGTAVGSNTALPEVNVLSVHADADVFFAKSQAGATAAADGGKDDRLFVAAGERRTVPWYSRALWVVNANAGELPKVRADGWG